MNAKWIRVRIALTQRNARLRREIVNVTSGLRVSNRITTALAVLCFFACAVSVGYHVAAQGTTTTLGAAFDRHVLAPALPESAFDLRFFSTAVKTDAKGEVITNIDTPTVGMVGAEAAGDRAGLPRFTKILFSAQYDTGTPGHRLDPNNQLVSSGGEHWPFVKQPMRSWPNAVAVTADGLKLYVTLPGREGYPDSRVAVVDTSQRRVKSWIDLRPAGQTNRTRPDGIAIAPVNTKIFPNAYAVVTNEYANFASVIDTATDRVLGEFSTGFYGEHLIFNAAGTRLYITDRFNDQVRAFAITAGPTFAEIADVPTGLTDLDRTNPRDLSISADGNTLYVANTLGHTIAVINIAGDANAFVRTMPVGGLSTDVKVAGRWGIVSGHETNNELNQPETGHGMPKKVNGVAIRNNGQPLGYLPVMTDATKATTFDDIGTELNVFDTATNRFVQRYVDFERNKSMLVTPGQIVDLGDFGPGQLIIKGSGAEQMTVHGDLLFVSQLHSDQIEVFRINQTPADPSQILTELGMQFTGGITPQGLAVSPDGQTLFVANMQTEDVSFLGIGTDGTLTRQGTVTVGVTDQTPDPVKGGNGDHLFATHEEVGLRWLFTQSYSDDGQKSCGHCHWQSRHDGNAWNVGGNAVGGPKAVPQNKDLSDNWPQWFEGLLNNMSAYASTCNGELIVAERVTALFPQATLAERLQARDAFVQQKTAENSRAIGRPDLSGDAFSIGYYEMAFRQILWTQNETRLMPNPLTQFPDTVTKTAAAQVARGKDLFTKEVAEGGSGCASCHHNGNKITNGQVDDTFQDFNIHEPGVVAETTVSNDGVFLRKDANYIFKPFAQPADSGGRQNISSRNTKHLRAFWDSVPRWLNHGAAHTIREILLPPDSPLLKPGERGFNFRTVRTDHSRAVAHSFLGGPRIVLPTEVPITMGDSRGGFAGDANGPIYVSLDPPTQVSPPDKAYPEGRLMIDRLGSDNLAPLIVNGQINPALAANNIAVIKDTHGKTSQLSASDIEAISMYLKSLEKAR